MDVKLDLYLLARALDAAFNQRVSMFHTHYGESPRAITVIVCGGHLDPCVLEAIRLQHDKQQSQNPKTAGYVPPEMRISDEGFNLWQSCHPSPDGTALLPPLPEPGGDRDNPEKS